MYQQYVNATNRLAEKYGDKFHYLLVYVVEAHPKAPDACPYRGKPWEHAFSNYSQPVLYQQRLDVASHINDIFTLNEAYTVVIDNLTPHNTTEKPAGNDNVWCTWGPSPNAGWLIDTNGTIVESQPWFDIEKMDKAMGSLVGLVDQDEDDVIKVPDGVKKARAQWTREWDVN